MALSVMELCFKQYLLIKKALLIFSVLKYQYALEKINQYSLETVFNKIINWKIMTSLYIFISIVYLTKYCSFCILCTQIFAQYSILNIYFYTLSSLNNYEMSTVFFGCVHPPCWSTKSYSGLWRMAVFEELHWQGGYLSLIHIWRCRRYAVCRSRWSPYH